MQKLAPLLVLLAVLAATPAGAQSVRSCEDARVGLTSLVTPVGENSRGYYKAEGGGFQVYVYNLDTIEPAAASSGLAFVLPDPDSEFGDSKCLAIIQLNGIDIMKAEASYQEGKGLALVLPKSDYDHDAGSSRPGEPLKVRINLETGTVVIE